MRSINNVVDITNYVMLLTAQPLHAFDLDHLAGPAIVVRRATDGEKIVTLDGQERTLGTDNLVIADAGKPAVIAGIFGAEFAEVSGSTTRVLLEAATFDGPNIIRTSLGLGLRTESSARFEKGQPRELPPYAMALACRLLTDLAGAKLVPGALDAHEPSPAAPVITLRHQRVGHILGVDISADESATTLERLGCAVDRGADAHTVTVPWHRVADLQRANNFVQSVRNKGFHVCLDDFGAGAASFQYLSVLEVDVVKLDGSAVQNAQKAPKGRAFMKALTTLCKTMKVETIAEMVDSKEALEFVRDCGVDHVQGWLFGKPDPDPWSFIKKLDRRLFS